jgi:hypothetical protein
MVPLEVLGSVVECTALFNGLLLWVVRTLMSARPKSLQQWYINTVIVVLDYNLLSSFYLKQNALEAGFCLHNQVKICLVGPT